MGHWLIVVPHEGKTTCGMDRGNSVKRSPIRKERGQESLSSEHCFLIRVISVSGSQPYDGYFKDFSLTNVFNYDIVRCRLATLESQRLSFPVPYK